MKQLDEETECKKMSKLEFLILNILRLHGREIDPDLGEKSKQIYEYDELSLYTEEEIAEASRRMYKKGWIYIFDEGTPYWHELKDKGRIALREHLEKNSEEDKMQQPSTRKPTYIKEQKNYNCQQFFGNISGCTFTMPSADSARQKAESLTPNGRAVHRGQQKQYLFIDGKPTVENVQVRNEEKQRFMRYLSEHNLKNRKLTCVKTDTLNAVIVCFLEKWREKGYTAEHPSGGAVFRFLTEECGINSEVTEQSYSNEIRDRMREKNHEYETMSKVETYFNL